MHAEIWTEIADAIPSRRQKLAHSLGLKTNCFVYRGYYCNGICDAIDIAAAAHILRFPDSRLADELEQQLVDVLHMTPGQLRRNLLWTTTPQGDAARIAICRMIARNNYEEPLRGTEMRNYNHVKNVQIQITHNAYQTLTLTLAPKDRPTEFCITGTLPQLQALLKKIDRKLRFLGSENECTST